MARPTNDKKSRDVHVRVNDDTDAKLQEMISESGMSLSECIREALKRGLKPKDMLEECWDDVANSLGITQIELFEAVSNAVDKKALYSRNGKLFFTRGAALTPDYISVDSAIDSLKIPEWKKTNYKNKILKDISGGINDYSDDWA